MRNQLLFAEHDLRAVLEGHERKMLDEIDGVDADRLLNTSDDDWCVYLLGEYTIEVPVRRDRASGPRTMNQLARSVRPFG